MDQNDPASFISYSQKITGSNLSFKMVPIPAGSFTIGSDQKEKGHNADEGPKKEIKMKITSR